MKQEVFPEECGFNMHKLIANMKKVSVVGQKCVFMNGVLGFPNQAETCDQQGAM